MTESFSSYRPSSSQRSSSQRFPSQNAFAPPSMSRGRSSQVGYSDDNRAMSHTQNFGYGAHNASFRGYPTSSNISSSNLTSEADSEITESYDSDSTVQESRGYEQNYYPPVRGSSNHASAMQHVPYSDSRRRSMGPAVSHHPISPPHSNRTQPQHIRSRSQPPRSEDRERYPSQQSRIPVRMHESSRSHSSKTSSSSSQSYSSQSRSSSSSYPSPPRGNYRPVHSSRRTPTVVHMARHYPTVVPINGGVGGYVVVPAAGQNVTVMKAPKPFSRDMDGGLLKRLFSPSKWTLSRKRYY